MKLLSKLFVLASLASLGAIGCSADATSADNGDEAVGEASQDLTSSVDVPNPSGAYFARITANGTGCKPGTWTAEISPDGKAFTVAFGEYEAMVEPGQAMAIKDCTLSIGLHSPSGLSFAVSSFHYQGYALLDSPSMSARQTAKYYFQGNPVPAQENRSDMRGPFDDSYVFSDRLLTGDFVWSPCGVERNLNAQTRIVLRNNPRKTGSGYLNTTSVDGEVRTPLRISFGLDWRRC